MANTSTPMTPLDLPLGNNISPTLDDYYYRLILKAKIIQNQWKGTKKEFYDFWQEFFPNNPILIQDNQDMTMTILITGLDEGIERGLITHGYIFPKPAGVRINFIFASDPLFGYDLDTPFVKGYDLGSWASF